MKKRWLSLLLVIAMALSLFPAGALAADEGAADAEDAAIVMEEEAPAEGEEAAPAEEEEPAAEPAEEEPAAEPAAEEEEPAAEPETEEDGVQAEGADALGAVAPDDAAIMTGDDRDPAVVNVENLIAAIGWPITAESESKIKAARAAYNKLSAAQKDEVTNYADLLEAEARLYDVIRATEFAYDGDAVKFINAGGAEFDAYKPQGNTLAYLYNGKIAIEYYPKDKATYEGFFLGADIRYPDHWLDDDITAVPADSDGNFNFDLPTAKAGYAWPVAPVTSSSETTTVQYYLAIPNMTRLEANYVVRLIMEIGTVTSSSGPIIEAAREAYEDLTDEQKAMVYNYDGLQAAEEEYYALVHYDKFAYAGNEITFIDISYNVLRQYAPQGGTLAYLEGDTIHVTYCPSSKNVYVGFYYGDFEFPEHWADYVGADASGNLVFELSKDKAGYAWPVAPVKADLTTTTDKQYYLAVPNTDQLKANYVVMLIDNIGNVTPESIDAVRAAREAYDALTAAQQALVENYPDLLDAEEALYDLLCVPEFAYAGTEVKFVENDGVTAFSMWAPKSETTIYIDGDTIYVNYIPNYVTTYAAFYAGDINYPDFWTDYVAANSSGVLVFTLDKDYAGKAWPVAPVEKAHPDRTTSVQYYLAIPNTDVLKANKVIYMIAAIGDVTAASKPAVKAAREAYDALTDAQKLYVDNYEVLYLAEERLFEILHVDEWPYYGDVVQFIDEYGNELSQYAAQEGSIAYLTEDDTIHVEFYPRNKQTFTGFKFGDVEYPRHWEGYYPANDKGDLIFTLDKDYAEFAWPVAPVRSNDTSTDVQYYLAIPGEDQLIANNVVRMIWAIGTVTDESEAAVTAARKAYDELTAAQQALIDPDDYKILTKAEEALYSLVRSKEFKYAGDGVRFINAAGEDLSTFSPLDGSIAYLYVKDGLIHVEYNPKNKAYISFYLGGDIRFESHWADSDITAISANPDGTYSFTLDADKAGYAWPVVLEKLSGPETDKQHYLAIPVQSQLEINCAIYLIDQIGEVDASKKEAIQEARAAYNLLTDAQKKKVTNYDKLEAAEQALEKLIGAYEFIYSGAELSFVRVNGEPFTLYGPEEGTFAYYDSGKIVLSYYPKDKTAYKGFYFGDVKKPAGWADYVAADSDGNYVEFKLDTDMAGYAWPVAPVKADGTTTTVLQYFLAIPGDPVLQANTVIRMIDSIGTVTAASQTAIEAARAAYDALADEQKRLVGNYKVLEAAEYALYQLIGAKALTFIGPDVVFIDKSSNIFVPYLPETGSIAYIENGKIEIEYYPKDKDTYDGFYFGDIRYPKYWEDFVAASKKGNLFLTLGTEMAGKALPVAPVTITENSDGTTTETTTTEQYYLAIPGEDQLKANYVAILIDAIGTVEATEESAALIEAARDAFDELDPTQQALVGNAGDLIAAESAYAAMPHTPRLVLTPGDALLMLVDEGKAEVESLDQFGNKTSDSALIASWVVKVDSSQVEGKTTIPFDIKYQAVGADGKAVDLAGKISYSTNDKKIVTVSAKADGTAKATITAKANGAATITATAKSIGAEGSMSVYVREYSPRLQSKSITVNSWKTDGVDVPLRPGYENTISSVSIPASYASKFKVTYTDGVLNVKTVGEQKNGTTKNVPLTVKAADKDYTYKLNITVKNAKPAVTVKQTQKYNTFYTDSEAIFQLSAPGAINSVTFETATYESVLAGNKLTVTKKSTAPAKTVAKGTLTVNVDGYTRPFTKTISVATVNTKPDLKLSKTSFTINTAYGEKSVKFGFVGTAPTAPSWKISPATAASLAYASGEFTMTSLANKKATATISVQESNWAKPMTFKVTLKVNSKLPTAKAARGTLLLNTEYPGQTDATAVTLNAADVKLSNGAITLTPKGDTSAVNEAQKLVVKYQNGEITAKFGTSLPRAGTYSFTMKPKLESGKELKEITVKVKVSNNSAIAATVSASGKLDALKRDSTAITYTVTALDSITGKITGVKVTGTDAVLFNAELVSEPAKGIAQAKLTLKKDAVVSTKASYQIALSFTVEGLPAKAVTKTLTVKVTQSTLKLAASPKTATLFQGQDVTKPAEYVLKVTSPEGVAIQKIAVSSKTPLALRKSLVNKANVAWELQADGTYLIKVTVKDPSKVVNGKSYNLTLDVTPVGCAENVNPTITVVVKVMK